MTEPSESAELNGQPKQKAPLSLACEVCRKKKIKCSGKPGPCTHCKQTGKDCVFAAGPKPRRTPVRSSKRIDGLDKRLSQIEALLRDAVNPVKQTEQQATPPSKEESSPSVNGCAQPKGNGVVPRPAGLQSALPPLSEGLLLANQYFSTMNHFLPLFNEESIMQSMEKEYGKLEGSNPTLWAAVNVVFALAHQLSAQKMVPDGVDHPTEALNFVKNAMSVVGLMSAREPAPLCLQVLLGIAKFWQSTSSPQTATMYLAMAVRQIYHLNLHRSTEQSDTDDAAQEWNKRLFWYAYSLDKDFSLRLDQPYDLKDEDLDITLPSWNPSDEFGFLPTKSNALRINYFRLQANLAIVQGKTYTRLYSRASLRQPQTDLALNSEGVCDLVSMLLAWRTQIPLDFDAISLVDALPQPSITAMVVMYVRYFNCMTMLHRLSYWKVGHLEAYKSGFENIGINPCASHALCIDAARTSLRLFSVLPQGNVPVMWLLNDYFVSAVVILLAGIIYESFLSYGWQDLQLVEPAILQLDLLARHGDAERLEHIRNNCMELLQAARNLLNSYDEEATGDYYSPTTERNPARDGSMKWLFDSTGSVVELPTS